MPSRRREEAGITMILVAIALTAIMILAALFIDGSNDYATRRTIQNSADAGAMAGALALQKAQAAKAVGTGSWPQDPTNIQAAVVAAVSTHAGASVPAAAGNPANGCDIVNSTGGILGQCSDGTNWGTTAAAAGVRVLSFNSRSLFFGIFANKGTQSTTALAIATIQPIVGGPTPFVICGDGNLSPSTGGYDLLTNTSPYKLDLPSAYKYASTSTPLYTDTPPIEVQSNRAPQCGAGSSADGKASGGTVGVGGTVTGNPGNGSNPVPNYTAPVGGTPCPADVSGKSLAKSAPSGCDILLPIANAATGNGSSAKDPITYTIAAFGVFHITGISIGSGNYKVNGWLVDPQPDLTSGETGTGTCNSVTSPSGPCVIKLFQ